MKKFKVHLKINDTRMPNVTDLHVTVESPSLAQAGGYGLMAIAMAFAHAGITGFEYMSATEIRPIKSRRATE